MFLQLQVEQRYFKMDIVINITKLQFNSSVRLISNDQNAMLLNCWKLLRAQIATTQSEMINVNA